MVAPAAIALQRARAKAAKGKPRQLEAPIHRACLTYLRRTLPAGFILHHCANKPRSAVQGGQEKALGAIKGWPDIAVYGPGPDGPSAWFAEVKAPGGKVSDEQREVHDRLLDAGFSIHIVRSVEDMRKAVSDWRLPSTDSLIVRRTA